MTFTRQVLNSVHMAQSLLHDLPARCESLFAIIVRGWVGLCVHEYHIECVRLREGVRACGTLTLCVSPGWPSVTDGVRFWV